MNASDSVKEKILAQRHSKSSGPPTKNYQLPTNGRSVYTLDFELDGDDYYSDYTANSEATYDFNASSAVVYDATGDNDSDGESVLEGQELTVKRSSSSSSNEVTASENLESEEWQEEKEGFQGK